MFSQTLTDSASSSTSLISKFFTHASRDSGLIISTCAMNPSGCHAFGANLKAEFPNLDYMAANYVEDFFFQGIEVAIEPAYHSKKWENIFITGCVVEDAAFCVNELKMKYDFSGVKHIYVIETPHLSKEINDTYTDELKKECISFHASPEKISLLTSGIDSKPMQSIGLPCPYPLLESKYEVGEKCLGLMYDRNSYCFKAPNGQLYLDAYFGQVASIAKSRQVDSPVVMAVGIKKVEEKALLDEMAKKQGIRMEYPDRLSQADFIQAIKNLGSKGGLISCDGVQTLMQVFCLKAKAFYFNDVPQNTAFCQQVVNALPEEMRPIANAILGQGGYSALKDEKQMDIVFDALQSLLEKSVEVFENNKKLAEAQSGKGLFKPFGDLIKEQLKRITGIEWSYTSSTEMAQVVIENKHRVELIKKELSLHGINLVASNVATQSHCMIDCSRLSVNRLQEILPLRVSTVHHKKLVG